MPRVYPRPWLTPDVVGDEESLADAICSMLEATASVRRRRGPVRRAQNHLKRAAGQRGWRAYLAVEAATNARYEYEARLIAQWAFECGMRLAAAAGDEDRNRGALRVVRKKLARPGRRKR